MGQRPMRGRYTPEDFYEHGKNRLTQTQIAERYGVSTSAISQQFTKPHLKTAYKAGKNGNRLPLTQTAAISAPVTSVAETIPYGEIKTAQPPEELPYAEVERRILAAIDDYFCTEPGIKNHAGFAREFDISEILSGMVADRKIRREKDADVTTAYFRFNWKVKRYWRDGTAQGRLGIEFETGDGVARRDVVSLTKTKAEIFRKMAEISELLRAL